MVGNDQHINTFITINQPNSNSTLPSVLTALVEKLIAARENDERINHIVQSLLYYKRKREASDGINGLEAKLVAGNREYRREDAIDQKVLFEQLLEEWSFFASAQEIFAHLLSKIDYEFKSITEEHCAVLSESAVDRLVLNQVLNPIVEECSQIPLFHVNLNVALGMLYWLADQCFIRWHK